MVVNESMGRSRPKQPPTAVAHFSEDDNEVEVDVDAPPDGFMSEGELPSSESDPGGCEDSLEDYDQDDQSSAMEGEHHSRSRSRSQTKTRSRSRSQASFSHSPSINKLTRKRKAKKESYRRSVEQKLDNLTDALDEGH